MCTYLEQITNAFLLPESFRVFTSCKFLPVVEKGPLDLTIYIQSLQRF